MQVIAPDFHVPFGGTSPEHNEERSGDGLFDALLREEEARYEREPQQTREYPEAPRRERDDFGRDEPLRDARAERPEDGPADDRDVAREAEPPHGDDHHDHRDETRPAAANEDGSVTETVAADDSGIAGPQTEVPAGDTTDQAEGGHKNGPAVPQQAQVAAAVPITDQGAKTPDPITAAGGQTNTTANGVAATEPAATAQSAATAPAPTAQQTTTQPAGAAATTQPTTDKTSPAATAKEASQVAAANRQTPSVPPVAPAENGNKPSGGTAKNTRGAGQEIATTTTDSLSSRPSAALGGGAATAAMARPDNAKAPAKTGSNLNTTENGLQGAGNKAAQQPNQTVKAPETMTAASPNKAAQANLASVPVGGDTASTSASNSAPTTTVTGSGAFNNGSVQNSNFAEALANARPGPSADPAEQIALQVRRAQVAGQEQINIKLHPAELGRIEVKLESSSDGTIRAVISAERSDTLDLLQRDARGLERALQEAGVKTDSGSLNFNLRGQGQGQEQQADGAPGRAGVDDNALTADSGEAEALQHQPPRSSHDGTLDIRV